MKKWVKILIIVVILLVLLIPIPIHVKDGGTVEYTALTYKVSKVHRIAYPETGYENGIIVEIFGFEVYNNVK